MNEKKCASCWSFSRLCITMRGTRGGVEVKALRYKPAGRGFDSRCCHWNFSVTYSFRSHYGPGVDSACNRNEYQVYFLGGKGGRCVTLTNLRPYCAAVMKSGNLNFLETSGPLQACNGTPLPLPLCISLFSNYKKLFKLRYLTFRRRNFL
jgi:hypothetical protein